MTLCGMCGNDFGGGSECPFCGTFQHAIATGTSKRKRRTATVNLKRAKPSVGEAIGHLDREIASARMKGIRLIRLVHGWGSSGEGGAIRAAVASHLSSLLRNRKVASFTPGEDYSEYTNAGRRLMAKYPSLRSSLRKDRENPGITFVELP